MKTLISRVCKQNKKSKTKKTWWIPPWNSGSSWMKNASKLHTPRTCQVKEGRRSWLIRKVRTNKNMSGPEADREGRAQAVIMGNIINKRFYGTNQPRPGTHPNHRFRCPIRRICVIGPDCRTLRFSQLHAKDAVQNVNRANNKKQQPKPYSMYTRVHTTFSGNNSRR